MAAATKKNPKVKKKPKATEEDLKPQVGPHAEDSYKHLGFEGRLPDELVGVHNRFKHALNTLTPGKRITPEGFATIVAIYETSTGA